MNHELETLTKERNTENFYDQHHFASPHKTGLNRKKILTMALPIEGKVLDVGCGTGRMCRLIHELNDQLKITGIDISSQSLKELPSYVNAKHGSALRLPFKNNSFDFVLAAGVLHHTPNARKGFEECVRVLKPKQRIVVGLYNKWNGYPLIYNVTKHAPMFIKDKIKSGFLQDQFLTPQATFHSFKQVRSWFDYYNVELEGYVPSYIYPPYFFPKAATMIYYIGVKVERND